MPRTPCKNLFSSQKYFSRRKTDGNLVFTEFRAGFVDTEVGELGPCSTTTEGGGPTGSGRGLGGGCSRVVGGGGGSRQALEVPYFK